MRPQVKKILILSLGLFLVGAVALGVSFYVFYLDGIVPLKEEIAKKDQELKEKQALKAQIPKLEADLLAAKIRAQKARQQIPRFDENEFDRFLRTLRDMALSTGVLIKAPKPAAARQAGALPPDIVRATYDLSVAGEFKRLKDFVNVLENSIRFIDIESFDFGKGKDLRASGESIGLTLRLNVYALRAPAAPLATLPEEKQPENLTSLPPK